MTIGARFIQDASGRRLLRMPSTTEKCVLLPTRADKIVGVAELFSGGMNGWSRAARLLPAEVAVKVDHEGMSVATTLLNDASARLFTDKDEEAEFNVFWGGLMDLRWLPAMHTKNVEVFCVSPPGKAYQAGDRSQGMADGQSTSAMWQFFMICRFTQRRSIILEIPVAFAQHKDKQTTMDIMKWAGYTAIWEGFFDPCQMVPAHKRRFYIHGFLELG